MPDPTTSSGRSGTGSEALPREPDRILIPGRPDLERCDNKVVSARYTLWNFVPIAVAEQFRRFANMYFLVVGTIMAVGYYYPNAFQSAVSPWTTLGPLAVVISISLGVEASADLKRHKNDEETNNAPCVILRRSEELTADAEFGATVERDNTIMKGKDVIVNINKAYYAGSTGHSVAALNQASEHGNNAVLVKIAFQKIRRMDIRQGHFILVKNREMVPADMVLLASSNDQGGAYIETSSIDGETNLKLRNSPHLPKSLLKALRDGAGAGDVSNMMPIEEAAEDDGMGQEVGIDSAKEVAIESIEAATRRITRFSALGRPEGQSALDHPAYEQQSGDAVEDHDGSPARKRMSRNLIEGMAKGMDTVRAAAGGTPMRRSMSFHQESDGRYVAALTTEPPNASVHTFSGKLTLPPFDPASSCHDIPLGAENILLRGAVLRNTEWAIGIACFTGTDTKLVQNSFKTPSKFSQLDKLMNNIVLAILCIMFLVITYLASQAVVTNDEQFDQIFYVGYNANITEPWPYLPATFEPPDWTPSPSNWIQFFFMYITLLNNFVPLSLYVTVEFVTVCSLWFIYADQDMYDDTTDTRAVARSTIVTDLGRIQYIFSDKTGTLTQNVMRFKRCSVDGMIFGAPIARSRPGADDDDEATPFHPLRQLTVGQVPRLPGLEGLGSTYTSHDDLDDKMTFNAEMFLRVMSLCHTVVVEKDIDKKDYIDASTSVASNKSSKSMSSMAKSLFRRKRTDTAGSASALASPLSAVNEDTELKAKNNGSGAARARTSSQGSVVQSQNPPQGINVDGAPLGYAYQAESPDEGALVSAASSTFGFQVVGRDSSGIRLRVGFPSHFRDEQVQNGLKKGSVTLARLAAETASDLPDTGSSGVGNIVPATPIRQTEVTEELWTILAVNKFDSDRKRMSVLLRAPPELGGFPILFCKGADSAMMDPEVCTQTQPPGPQRDYDVGMLVNVPKPSSIVERGRDVSNLNSVSEGSDDDDDVNGVDTDGWHMAHMLGLQTHLGDFAKEGLRTLVLAMRILTEKECEAWLEEYKAAATSIKNRSELLTQAALSVEKNLHIVGATAIEDKLQRGVPKTIATLGKAGIKLWVLTGDKRETAVEIGYSTNVLTPKMHLTEVPDNGGSHVQAQMAMEFIRLVKMGKLVQYQKVSLDDKGPKPKGRRMEDLTFTMGKFWRSVNRTINTLTAVLYSLVGFSSRAATLKAAVAKSAEKEPTIVSAVERRRMVREKADAVIQEWLQSEEGQKHKKRQPVKKDHDGDDDLSLASEETPQVFHRASSAKELLKSLKGSGKLSQELRQLTLANLTAQQMSEEEPPVVDEDTLSLDSFFPGAKDDIHNSFDRKKRTLLERMFAIDRQVRKGRLQKHLNKSVLAQIKEEGEKSEREGRGVAPASDGPRALVIEGAALKHLLGDPELEEILFSVASNCDAVIACRVSPRQKALLVNLVRVNVLPEPITLAIGDGANDVGMIQEAHVGVGISGKEGKQAVNASDFAIAQFRFLEDLILVHGRWDFFRLSTVVLFSFYKNAVMAGCLVAFTQRTLYSGTPLFDQWIIAMLNFVAGVPIIMLGLFDRYLSKDYVRANPEVFRATRENELITSRTLARWIGLVFVHIFTLYLFTVPQQSFAGGMTSAWAGLMRNENRSIPGNGEGGDLQSVGTVTFTCLIVLLAYKVLFETRSLVHGRYPAVRCRRKDTEEGMFSRLAYTWLGVTYLSIGFYLFAIYIYALLGHLKPSSFSPFVNVTNHILGTRSLSWVLILFVPVAGMVFDVSFKVFSNLFYPTQTQIHLEIQSQLKIDARRLRRSQGRQEAWRVRQHPEGMRSENV